MAKGPQSHGGWARALGIRIDAEDPADMRPILSDMLHFLREQPLPAKAGPQRIQVGLFAVGFCCLRHDFEGSSIKSPGLRDPFGLMR